MPVIVKYQMRRYQDGVKYSSVLNFFLQTTQFLGSHFRQLRLEEICYSPVAWGITSKLVFFGSSALFKDGLNFDGRPLKIIGFYKHCFDKLFALLK